MSDRQVYNTTQKVSEENFAFFVWYVTEIGESTFKLQVKRNVRLRFSSCFKSESLCGLTISYLCNDGTVYTH